MIKHLFLVRHALAVAPTPLQKDFERELSSRGVIEASKMGDRLHKLGVSPSVMVTSPANRCLTTASLIAEQLGFNTDQLIEDASLYETSVRTIMAVINDLSEHCEQAMIIGHNPYLTYLAEFLTHAEIGNIPTCGVAHITFENLTWSEVGGQTGQLVWFEYPEKENVETEETDDAY
jgi:phosphohistidine phosphatase